MPLLKFLVDLTQPHSRIFFFSGRAIIQSRFNQPCTYSYVFVCQVTLARRQQIRNGPFDLQVKLPPVYHTSDTVYSTCLPHFSLYNFSKVFAELDNLDPITTFIFFHLLRSSTISFTFAVLNPTVFIK